MAEINYVVRDLKLSHEGVFDLKELYKLMKGWFNLHKFDFYEKEYFDVLKTDAKDIKLKWEVERKIDDYTKFVIETDIKINDHRIVEVKKGDKISIRSQSAGKEVFKDLDIKIKKYTPPAWIKFDKIKKEGVIAGVPSIIN